MTAAVAERRPTSPAENREAKATAIAFALFRRGMGLVDLARLPYSTRGNVPSRTRFARAAYREAAAVTWYAIAYRDRIPEQPPHSASSDTWRLVAAVLAEQAALIEAAARGEDVEGLWTRDLLDDTTWRPDPACAPSPTTPTTPKTPTASAADTPSAPTTGTAAASSPSARTGDSPTGSDAPTSSPTSAPAAGSRPGHVDVIRCRRPDCLWPLDPATRVPYRQNEDGEWVPDPDAPLYDTHPACDIEARPPLPGRLLVADTPRRHR